MSPYFTRILCLLAVASSLYGPVRAEQKSPHSAYTLETFCILPEDIAKIEPAKDPSDCAVRPTTLCRFPCKRELWVKNGNRCVAIVRVEPSNSAVLNPPGFNYGPIPALNMLRESDADVLWGTKTKQKIGPVVKYTLPTYQSADAITIETIFENSLLKKYRIVGISIPSAAWNTVE